MQPTPESTPTPPRSAPPVVGESLVEFVCADRQRTAFILLGVSVLLLALCGWAAYTASKTPSAAEKKADKEKADSPFPEPEEPEVKTKSLNRNEYITAAFLAGLGVLTTVCVGGWLLVSIAPIDRAQQKTQARAVILAAGGLLGAILILGSGAFFYLWGTAFNDWLDKGQVKQAKYVLGPLLAFAVGGLVMFLAIQPARAEERDNRTLRRLVYGANLGLSVLLMFVALLVANVLISPRLPNRLDVTGGSFYTLSDGSKAILGRLPEPMTAYVIMSSGRREADDIRRLVQNCQDASNGKLTVKFINPITDTVEYRKLAERAPKVKTHEVEGTTAGVYLTVGEDEKRNVFIRSDEFAKREQGANPREPGPQTFVGEARLMKEVLFLSESEEKAVVYFTQSAGELNIGEGAGDERRPTATARQLKEYLARNNLEVKPLKFDLKDPKVPDDAAVVIVADPKRELDPAHVAAISKYMTEPRPSNPSKKGKLIVLAGAAFGPKKEVIRTGLEGLLMEFQVRLDPRVVVGQPTNRDAEPYAITAAFSVESLRARNPVAMALGEKATFPSLAWRQVRPVQGQKGAGAYRAVNLLLTADPDRFTWVEDHLYSGEKEFDAVLSELSRNPAVKAAKELTDEPRPVAVAVSESVGDAGRVVVVGNGLLVSDFYAMQAGGEPPGFDLISGSVDWLRERPTLNIQVNPKTYTEFKFPATTDENRGLFLPLLLSVTVVGGLGVCVWLVRRTA